LGRKCHFGGGRNSFGAPDQCHRVVLMHRHDI
jgi:hypothetical protein